MSTAVPFLSAVETAQVLRENEALHRENRLLELEVQKLERQLWSPRSERYGPGDENQSRLFEEPVPTPPPPAEAKINSREGKQRGGAPEAPKPLEPSLRTAEDNLILPYPDRQDAIQARASAGSRPSSKSMKSNMVSMGFPSRPFSAMSFFMPAVRWSLQPRLALKQLKM